MAWSSSALGRLLFISNSDALLRAAVDVASCPVARRCCPGKLFPPCLLFRGQLLSSSSSFLHEPGAFGASQVAVPCRSEAFGCKSLLVDAQGGAAPSVHKKKKEIKRARCCMRPGNSGIPTCPGITPGLCVLGLWKGKRWGQVLGARRVPCLESTLKHPLDLSGDRTSL